MVNFSFQSNTWFDIQDEPNEWIIATSTSCGNSVEIHVRKSKPYSKHFKQLIKDLNAMQNE